MDKTIEKLTSISESKVRRLNMEYAELLKVTDSGTHNRRNYFLYLFQSMPNTVDFYETIDGNKLRNWIIDNYNAEIKDCVYNKDEKDKGFIYYLFHLFDDLLIYHDRNYTTLYYRKTSYEKVDKMVNEINKLKRRKTREKPEIKLLVNSCGGLDTKEMDISKPKLSIEDNYNDDFLPIHKTILSRLQKKNDKGLVLLHGKPGTGKTSYLRYLIAQTKKDVIFLPPNMAASITDPGLMNVLIDNPNSVFVIEDAENIVIDRNRSGSSSVSALLNLADGLLSDCLNIQIICSFNTDLSRVDSALMRKGRLIAKYEFNELQRHKAQALSDKLGFDTVITEPMTLAQIYNQNEAEFSPTTYRRPIGFQIAV